ncbi:MAG: PrsW family intramembrane metalloprotease [Candidatus Altiarchaeota archaeon]|nr:PrsW family intramembrane metalloprotease [Candidatus Altiarchaeota archaeon]
MDILPGVLLSLLFGLAPMAVFAAMVTKFDRFEREPPKLLLIVFLWGFFVASAAALVLNAAFEFSVFYITGSPNLADASTAVLSAPVVEETVKGLGVLIAFLYYRRHFDSLLDGVIYGSMVGFGFAAAENVLYIFGGYLTGGLAGLFTIALLRTLFVPFLHAMLTSLTGMGFAVARLSRGNKRFIAPLAGYLAAVFFHGLHNFLAKTSIMILQLANFFIDWAGFAAIIIYVIALMRHEQGIMEKQLKEEVARGNITEEQYLTAVSQYKKTIECWKCLDGGYRRRLSRFYDLMAKLAFRKYRREAVESDRETDESIEELRRELKVLGGEIK